MSASDDQDRDVEERGLVLPVSHTRPLDVPGTPPAFLPYRKSELPLSARTVRERKAAEAVLAAIAHLSVSDTAAARKANIDRRYIADWRKSDPDFAVRYQDAREQDADNLEDEMTRRAWEGTLEPIVYQGDHCGWVRKLDNNLLMRAVEARKPEKYRQRSEQAITGAQGAPLAVNITRRIIRPKKEANDAS